MERVEFSANMGLVTEAKADSACAQPTQGGSTLNCCYGDGQNREADDDNNDDDNGTVNDKPGHTTPLPRQAPHLTPPHPTPPRQRTHVGAATPAGRRGSHALAPT